MGFFHTQIDSMERGATIKNKKGGRKKLIHMDI
jgi:hypothetical protein